MKRIQLLIDKGEGSMLDFKKEISSVHRISKTIVSFANHHGGTLLIGVNDDGSIAGIKVAEEQYMLEQAARFFCYPPIELQIHEWNMKGRSILEVIIPEGDAKPYSAIDESGKRWVYIRHRDQSLLASKVVVEVLRRQQSQRETVVRFTSKEEALMQYLKSNHRITMKEFCKMLNLSRRRAMQILVNLLSIGIIRVHQTEFPEYYTLADV